MNRKWTYPLLTVLIIFLLAFHAVAAGSLPKVVDEAGLLTESQISKLETRIENIVETYGMDIVILTVDSLGHKTATDYADDYYDYHGYGIGTSHSGLLFLIAMEEREWAVSTCGDAIHTVTDREIDRIIPDIAGQLSDGEYFEAFDSFLDRIETQYKAGIDSDVTDPGNILHQFVIALVIGAAIAGIVLLVMRSNMNTAKAQSGAGSYLTEGSYDLYRCQDIYLYSRTTKVRKAENNSSGSHRSSSGRSHGGRSGRF